MIAEYGGMRNGRASALERHKYLDRLFEARSVCFVGVSVDPAKMTGRPLEILRRHRFDGEITLVNPHRREIGGIPCYPSVSDLPAPADVAVISVAAETVPDVIRECGRVGIHNAIVLTSGFEELSDGRGLGRQLRAAAEEAAVNIVGPNSEGVWVTPGKLILTFGSVARRDHIRDGPVSVLSQSGSIGGAVVRNLQDAGIGCRHFVSLGNEANLSILDVLEYIIDENQVSAVLLFIEALNEGHRLKALARAARERNIALVALNAGTSALGQEATLSHTGKLASPTLVYSEVFRQVGILKARSVSELGEAAETLATAPELGTSAATTPGIGIVSVSGGGRALIADACEEMRVPVARFSAEVVETLTSVLPRFGYAHNPVDITGKILDDPALFDRSLRIVAADDAVEALLIQYANRAREQIQENVPLICGLAASCKKPIVLSTMNEDVPSEATHRLQESGVLLAHDPRAAVRLLSWLYQRRGSDTDSAGAVPETSTSSLEPETTTWDWTWASQMTFLSGCGIDTPRSQIISPDAPIASGLAYPLAVKALPEDAAHKTERGLLELGVAGAGHLEAAVARLRAALGPGKSILVQEMSQPGIEVLLGARQDPDFGPVLALGSGGVLAEVYRDVTYLSLPVTAVEVRVALSRLRVGELLSGVRGMPPGDISALVDAAVAFGNAFASLRPPLQEFEINPLFVMAEGEGVTAVDALVVPQDSEQDVPEAKG